MLHSWKYATRNRFWKLRKTSARQFTIWNFIIVDFQVDTDNGDTKLQCCPKIYDG